MKLNQVVGRRLWDRRILNVTDHDIITDTGSHKFHNFGQTPRQFRCFRCLLGKKSGTSKGKQAKGNCYRNVKRKTTRFHTS